MWLFSDSQYGFRCSQSTADPLTVISDRIARVFNRPGATPTVALDISKAFGTQLMFYGISGQTFGLISSFLSIKQL